MLSVKVLNKERNKEVSSVLVAMMASHRVQVRNFPHVSVGTESACNAGDPGLIRESRRFLWRREWQPTPEYFCLENSMDKGAWQATVHGVAKSRTHLSNQHLSKASPMAQRVKNLSTRQEMQETWVRSLVWEDLLEKEITTHSSVLA